MDVKKLLKGTDYEDVAEALTEEFKAAGITPETLHNAPLKVHTHGADIYDVIRILEKKLGLTEPEQDGGRDA